MRIRLDGEACVGHGRCYVIAPEVVDADDQGHCVVRPGDAAVSAPMESQARSGVANCPERALSIDG